MQKVGMSRSTRRCAYAALRGALADAVDNELLATDPVEKVKRPRASTPGATSHAGRRIAPDRLASVGLDRTPAARQRTFSPGPDRLSTPTGKLGHLVEPDARPQGPRL